MILKKYPLSLLVAAFSLLCSNSLRAQENIDDFLVLGQVVAEEIIGRYMGPLGEGLSYGLVGGWYNSAKVADPWSISLGLVTNGSYVPAEKKQFTIDTAELDNLTTVLGEAVVAIPTALGAGNTDNITFIAQVENETYTFEAPAGLGLLYTNFLPNAFLQAKVGLPKYTEVGLRLFPNIALGNQLQLGSIGLGVQHEFSQWIPAIEKSPLAFSFLVAYTHLGADYDLDEDNDIDNQQIQFRVNSWLFELIGSTNFKVLNFYGGFGVLAGNFNTKLAGDYVIDLLIDSLEFKDPINAQSDISAVRASLGANLTLNWFSLNAAYTFQGYNNLSLGLNFTLN